MSSHGSRFFADFTPRPSRGIILAGGTAMYRILIVEDDPVIAETLCAYMGRWGRGARASGGGFSKRAARICRL